MNPLQVDVAVIGGGFGGSLMTLLLTRIGLTAALVEQGSHPRFAIGESSTPVADLVLQSLAADYDLPRLAPLAMYGPWKRTYPDVVCGLKRGFTYFGHEPGRAFEPSDRHHNELVVSSSVDDEHGDTHWLRADVDAFLFNEARRTASDVFDRTQITLSPVGQSWRIAARRVQQQFDIDARFVIDATGGAGVVAKTLGIPLQNELLHTNSRTVFGHFANLEHWHEVLLDAGARVSDHPFYCDNSAVHHLVDEGWMWQLRFDNGVTSAGFAIDDVAFPRRDGESPAVEWDRILARYPSLARKFSKTRLVPPFDTIWSMGRMQRITKQAAGENWAMLPVAAGFIDPLYSTGIGHTLSGLERLAGILKEHWNRPTLATELQQYGELVRREIRLIDLIVHGSYVSRRNFRLFAAYAMTYFAAATTYERRRLHDGIRNGFLCADDEAFSATIETLWQRLPRAASVSDREVRDYEDEVARQLAPYNTAGLCDPSVRNMYARTALPASAE
jgi:FADH2 O2-dependent halogenase